MRVLFPLPMASKNKTMKLSSTSIVKKSNLKIREQRRIRLSLKKLKAAMELISQVQQNLEKRGRVRKHGKKKNFKLVLEKQLPMMEAEVAEQRQETGCMRQELGNMIQATEDRETELEILRMRHTLLFNEMTYMSMVEEELMRSLRSPN